jgi:hypothetical protein
MQCDATVGSNPRNGRRTAVCLFVLAGPFLHASPAFGAKADIRTSAEGCADHDGDRLNELLAIEAETIGAEHAARPSDVLLECRGGVVSVRVSLRDGSGERSGVVDPGTADRSARTRLLALTISEFLAQLWSDVPSAAATVERATPPPGARPPDARPAASPAMEHAPAWLLHGGAALRSLMDPRAGLLGGTIGAELRLSRFVAIGVDVEGVFGSVRSEHADVGVSLGSTAVHAAFGRRFGDVTLGAGPGVRLGIVRFSPAVDSNANAIGHDVTGPWAGPFALALAQWTKDRFVVRTSFELGVATLPVIGTLNGQTAEVSLRGTWFAATVGAGVAF